MIFKNGITYIPELKDRPIYKNGIISTPNQFGSIINLKKETSVLLPSDIEGNMIWYTMRDTASVQEVQEIVYDKSGNGYDVSSANVTFDVDGANTSLRGFDMENFTVQDFTMIVRFKTTHNYGASSARFADEILIGNNRGGASNPNDCGLGIDDNKLYFFVNDYDVADCANSTVKINDGLEHVAVVTFDSTLGEINLYLDDSLQDTVIPTGNTYTDTLLLPHRLGQTGDSNKYFDGSIMEYQLYSKLLDPSEMSSMISDGVRDHRLEPRNLNYYQIIGSSIARGTGAIPGTVGWANIWNGCTYGEINNFEDLISINDSQSGSTTQYWINNYASFTGDNPAEYSNTLIGLSIGNESDDAVTYLANYTSLISLIRADGQKIVIQGNYVKNGGDYIKRQTTDKTLETTYDIDGMVSGEAIDDLTGNIIASANSGDGTHPNNIGHNLLTTSLSKNMLAGVNAGTFDFGTVPDSITNTTKSFAKADANTVNPIKIETKEDIESFTLTFEMKGTLSSGDNIMSTRAGSYVIRMFNDAGTVKFSDGTNTISTGVTDATAWKTYTLRFNPQHSMRAYVDGVFSEGANRVLSELESNLEIVLGGLIDNNANDVSVCNFRNIRLTRASIYESSILEDATGVYTPKRSQEFYNQFDDLGDLSNKSQTDTVMTVNDSNITLVV